MSIDPNVPQTVLERLSYALVDLANDDLVGARSERTAVVVAAAVLDLEPNQVRQALVEATTMLTEGEWYGWRDDCAIELMAALEES